MRIHVVGFVFNDAAAATDGTYKVFELKVWVVDPSYVDLKELEGGLDTMVSNEYSQVITLRFLELGVSPCIRKAHKSIEVISEAVFRETDEDNKDISTKEKFHG